MGQLTLKELLPCEQLDKYGNSHYVFEEFLIGSYFPKVSLNCRVWPDEHGSMLQVEHNGPLAVIYQGIVKVGPSLPKWIDSWDALTYRSFYGHAVINGLGFYTDVVPLINWGNIQFPSAHVTEYDYGDDSHLLACRLLLFKMKKGWNRKFLAQQREVQRANFYNAVNDIVRYG